MADPISPDTIRHVAHLARLKLTDAECEQFGRELSAIVEYVDQLREVDVSGVEPTAHTLPVQNVFREDVPAEPLGSERALANASAVDPPFFKVPKVLQQGEP